MAFKLATLTYNILNFSQPAYLRSLLSYHTPTCSLRFANANLLSVPHVRTTFASHGFSIAAPTVNMHVLTYLLHHYHQLAVPDVRA